MLGAKEDVADMSGRFEDMCSDGWMRGWDLQCLGRRDGRNGGEDEVHESRWRDMCVCGIGRGVLVCVNFNFNFHIFK